MSLRRYHGESANVHSSSNVHVKKEISTTTYETIAVVDVGEYNRMTWALFNLGADNVIKCQLMANLIKVPNTTDFSQANGWFVISNVTWQGLYTSNSYDHTRDISLNQNSTAIYHNFLLGAQYVALRARVPVTNTSSTLLATGHAAG